MEQVLRDTEQLSVLVIRALGLNPGPMTLQGTNTYLVGKSNKRLLIDTGEGKAGYKDLLQSILQSQMAEIEKVLITHHHNDHTMGIGDVLSLCPNAKI